MVPGSLSSASPVKVARTLDANSVIEQGLENDEVVVTDGHLLLSDGSRVTPRERRAPGV